MIEDRSSKLILCAAVLATIAAALAPSQGFAAAAGGRGAPTAGGVSSGAAAGTSAGTSAGSTGGVGGAGANGGGGAVEVDAASAAVGPLPIFQPPRLRAHITPVVESTPDPQCMPQRFVDPYGNVYLRRMCRQPQVW